MLQCLELVFQSLQIWLRLRDWLSIAHLTSHFAGLHSQLPLIQLIFFLFPHQPTILHLRPSYCPTLCPSLLFTSNIYLLALPKPAMLLLVLTPCCCCTYLNCFLGDYLLSLEYMHSTFEFWHFDKDLSPLVL